MSKKLAEPHKKFTDFFCVQQTEKKIAHKTFFDGKFAFFSQKFVFSLESLSFFWKYVFSTKS